MASDGLIEAVRRAAIPVDAERPDPGWLLDLAGDASVVLIGEASHGTHEYYRIRAELTRALIEEAGFIAVAAEADWPDAYRVRSEERRVGKECRSRWSP